MNIFSTKIGLVDGYSLPQVHFSLTLFSGGTRHPFGEG